MSGFLPERLPAPEPELVTRSRAPGPESDRSDRPDEMARATHECLRGAHPERPGRGDEDLLAFLWPGDDPLPVAIADPSEDVLDADAWVVPDPGIEADSVEPERLAGADGTSEGGAAPGGAAEPNAADAPPLEIDNFMPPPLYITPPPGDTAAGAGAPSGDPEPAPDGDLEADERNAAEPVRTSEADGEPVEVDPDPDVGTAEPTTEAPVVADPAIASEQLREVDALQDDQADAVGTDYQNKPQPETEIHQDEALYSPDSPDSPATDQPETLDPAALRDLQARLEHDVAYALKELAAWRRGTLVGGAAASVAAIAALWPL
jgi:hypothetical protein